MKVFIVYAHPEPKSFNGAMKDAAVKTLTEAGHEVKVSDLYAMRFKAVADEADFETRADPDFLKYQLEQRVAHEDGSVAQDILDEQEKLFWCDVLIMQCPLWWFSVPAIMKGWVDRVLTMGRMYGGGMWYNNGSMKGRKAMLSLTTGGHAMMYSQHGINGDINSILYPLNHGVLYFVGFTVLPPFIAWSAAHVSDERRAEYLEEYTARLLTLDSIAPMPYPNVADYDESFQLRLSMRI